METAKIFNNGGSQAVRLPKDYRFEDNEVYINRVGNAVIITPKDDDWSSFFTGLEMLSDDFLKGVSDLPVEDISL